MGSDMIKERYVIGEREITVYLDRQAEYLLIQPVDERDLGSLDRQMERMLSEAPSPFALAACQVGDWNGELSPWEAPPVFGKQGFGHGAGELLSYLEGLLIPEVKARFGFPERIPILLGGYSLAGLFSLWSAYRTSCFQGVAAVSPSVWFPGWMEFARAGTPQAKRMYLSLGDREEHTRNQVMARVGSCIREQYDLLQNAKSVECSTLEWNEGNHFKDPELRCAKGFLWCMKTASK